MNKIVIPNATVEIEFPDVMQDCYEFVGDLPFGVVPPRIRVRGLADVPEIKISMANGHIFVLHKVTIETILGRALPVRSEVGSFSYSDTIEKSPEIVCEPDKPEIVCESAKVEESTYKRRHFL